MMVAVDIIISLMRESKKKEGGGAERNVANWTHRILVHSVRQKLKTLKQTWISGWIMGMTRPRILPCAGLRRGSFFPQILST